MVLKAAEKTAKKITPKWLARIRSRSVAFFLKYSRYTSKLRIELTAMTCAERVDVHAMKVISRTAAAPPLPAIVIAAYGRTRPLLTSVVVILWFDVLVGFVGFGEVQCIPLGMWGMLECSRVLGQRSSLLFLDPMGWRSRRCLQLYSQVLLLLRRLRRLL